MSRTRITTAPWIYGVLAFGVAICTFGIAILSFGEPGWEIWGLVALLIIFSVALFESGFKKIEVDGEVIRIVENFRKKEIPKSVIEKVSWEKGTGSFVKLTNGTFVKLPITGRNEQGVANSVRSWLNRP